MIVMVFSSLNGSTDGGGVRGLSPIIILKEIMKAVNRGRASKLNPHEVFDLIGGTSTGGYVDSYNS